MEMKTVEDQWMHWAREMPTPRVIGVEEKGTSQESAGHHQGRWMSVEGKEEANKEEGMGREETKEDGGEEDRREEAREMGRRRKERDTKGKATTAERLDTRSMNVGRREEERVKASTRSESREKGCVRKLVRYGTCVKLQRKK